MKIKTIEEQTEEERDARKAVANGGFPYVYPTTLYTQGMDTAFPYEQGEEAGINKREYFASQNLKGILANPSFFEESSHQEQVSHAVKMADMLISELNK